MQRLPLDSFSGDQPLFREPSLFVVEILDQPTASKGKEPKGPKAMALCLLPTFPSDIETRAAKETSARHEALLVTLLCQFASEHCLAWVYLLDNQRELNSLNAYYIHNHPVFPILPPPVWQVVAENPLSEAKSMESDYRPYSSICLAISAILALIPLLPREALRSTAATHPSRCHSTRVCRTAALNIVQSFHRLPYSSPFFTSPSYFPLPCAMPVFAYCAMQCSYALLMLCRKGSIRKSYLGNDIVAQGYKSHLRQALQVIVEHWGTMLGRMRR